MGIIAQQNLFSWEIVETSPEILRLRRVLAALPDEKLIETLVAERKKRRDDYPLEAVWNALIAGVVFGHGNVSALIRELKRNAELRQVCGFDPLKGDAAVPPPWIFSRLLAKLVRHADLIEAMFARLRERLAELLPDYGVDLAMDGKAIPALGQSDEDADQGVKTYESTKADGALYKEVRHWFGYRLHLLVDANYELPVAYDVTRASEGESPKLLPLVEALEEDHPELHERIETLAADRGYDDGEDKAALHDDHGIAPLIDTRDVFSSTPEGPMRPLDARSHDTIYFDPTGRVCCKTRPFAADDGARYTPMQFMGFEADRQSLKFRCPAAALGAACDNRAACACRPSVRDGAWGRVVRVPLERDRRIFLPIHRHSRGFVNGYKKRTAVERVNSRIDHVYGFERHFIRGLRKVRLRMDLSMIVMLATAAEWVEAGHPENVRSLLTAA
jgi:hypothetical protein